MALPPVAEDAVESGASSKRAPQGQGGKVGNAGILWFLENVTDATGSALGLWEGIWTERGKCESPHCQPKNQAQSVTDGPLMVRLSRLCLVSRRIDEALHRHEEEVRWNEQRNHGRDWPGREVNSIGDDNRGYPASGQRPRREGGFLHGPQFCV